ncbi:MAG: hypothetical protein IKE75_00720 [Bacilli bacterium]|nr:hypothetical protein [Bacilli bacterium]
MQNEKGFEVMTIIVLVLIVLILLFPIIVKIVYSAQEKIIKTNVYTLINETKNVYLIENTRGTGAIYLPFKIEYNKDEYKTYCGDKQIIIGTKINIKGNKPLSGAVILNENDKIIVNNLKFKSHTCNKSADGEVKCIRNS